MRYIQSHIVIAKYVLYALYRLMAAIHMEEALGHVCICIIKIIFFIIELITFFFHFASLSNHTIREFTGRLNDIGLIELCGKVADAYYVYYCT